MELLDALKDYQHILLLAGIGWGYFKLKEINKAASDEAKAKEVERHEAAKDEIHAALANGIGQLVDKKNTEQDLRWTMNLRAEFQAHEARESESIRRIVESFPYDRRSNHRSK